MLKIFFIEISWMSFAHRWSIYTVPTGISFMVKYNKALQGDKIIIKKQSMFTIAS